MQGLNHELGEYVPELGRRYVVLKGELKRQWAESPFMQDAAEHAARVFRQSGHLPRVRFYDDDVLMQVYPDLAKLHFIFQAKIAGTPCFVHYTFDFSLAAIAELRGSDMWPELPSELQHVN